MQWRKLGKIFSPEMSQWAVSHCQGPTGLVLEDRIRVYFSGRTAQNRALPGVVDLDINDPTKVVKIYDFPCMGLGEPGTFDEDGVMPSWCTVNNNQVWMYYSGWNQKVSTPYHNSMGLCVSDDGLRFRRMYQGPIMDRTATEPFTAVTPTLLIEENTWKMWYISGVRWALAEGKYEPVYVIKYATSDNGVDWKRYPEILVPQSHQDEAFSRPSVIKINGVYHMWYCYRSSHDFRDGAGSYRMGYSRSEDGVKWSRLDDHAGIDLSENDWDSHMMCYPFVVNAKGKYFMFYNGNSFGRHGFGCAVLEGV